MTRALCLSLALLIGGAACRVEDADKRAPAPAPADDATIEVITGGQVDRLLKEVTEQERELWKDTREKLGDAFYDEQARRTYAERPELIADDLRKIAQDKTATQERRASASNLLVQFGEIDKLKTHDFDTEVDEVPCRHDLLIHELAALTHGRFEPAAVLETFAPKNNDDLKTPYKIEFVVADRLYRFSAQNLSGWYDVPPVLAALNRALADSGQPERFFPLETGDQTSSIIFGDPQEIQAAAKEGRIKLSEDADQPRRAGKAAEAAVEKKLGVK